MVRFIHTADWQLGKPFQRFGEKAESLRNARLDAIEALARLAAAEGTTNVLVAGDIFDSESPSNLTLRAALERMRAFPSVRWHLLPGNHDPHRPAGVWDRFMALGLPENIKVHVTTEPFALQHNCYLLPAPLTNKAEARDITLAMDQASTPDGAIRIGIAHGHVIDFQGGDGNAINQIDPDRATRARLSYLALGDWHRTQRVNDRTWYAGTPEPDRYGSQDTGRALLIEIEAPQVFPRVVEKEVGTYRWHADSIELTETGQLPDFESQLRKFAEPLSRLVLQLDLSGTFDLSTYQFIRDWEERLRASVFHLDYYDARMRIRPSDADLEQIDFDGVLRRTAERLRQRAQDIALPDPHRQTAEDALVSLFELSEAD